MLDLRRRRADLAARKKRSVECSREREVDSYCGVGGEVSGGREAVLLCGLGKTGVDEDRR